MQIEKWHPGQLVVFWVAGALIMFVIAMALPEIPTDHVVVPNMDNPYVRAFAEAYPDSARRILARREPLRWGQALYWSGLVAFFVSPVILLGVTWRWFGGRRRQ